MSKKHGGRIQAQGGGTEKSESWSQEEPLTKKELNLREKQFQDAERYIDNVKGGIGGTNFFGFYFLVYKS